MISKKEAFEAVINRKRVTFVECGNPVIDKINKKIVENVNNGWLCANLTSICSTVELLNSEHSLTDLGYTLKDGLLFWLFRD